MCRAPTAVRIEDMEGPKRAWFRFRLRTLLVAIALEAAVCGLATRHTDPLRVRKGMSQSAVWWHCGWPDARTNGDSTIDWTYNFEPEGARPTFVIVRFDGNGVSQAHLLDRDTVYPTFRDVTSE